jgi:hypothetical protein
MNLEAPQEERVKQSRLKKSSEKVKSWLKGLAKWWAAIAKPALLKALAAVVAFYKTRIHPTLAIKSSPEKRAIAAGRYLCRLAMIYGVLSVIGAIVMVFIKEETNECVSEAIFSDSCYEYAIERPYLTWAIVSLLVSLIVASFLFAFGSYVEAKMSKQLREIDRES